VEVTNLGNGKKVIVKVNDRGPFVSNRIIDLSYAAAKKLGMTGRGTADVLVRALDPKTFQTNAPSQHIFIAHNTKKSLPQQHSPIYLQVGAFQNKAHAEKLKIQLAGITSFPVNITEFVSTKKLYRVQIGPLHDTNTVAEINKKLKSIGFTSRTILV
jgi:rare lipoprotein A